MAFGFGGFLGVASIPQQTLFDRSWLVTIDTIQSDQHDIEFKVEKSLKPEPNKCSLKIYNLNAEQRAQIQELNPKTMPVSSLLKKKDKITARKQATTGIPCKIDVGYRGKTSQIWLGDLRHGDSEKNGTDWITHLESGDGEKAYQNARIHVSYGPGTPKDVALRAIVRALGLGDGNVAKVAAGLTASGAAYLQGTVISGPVAQQLTDFCRSAELEWSIQDGTIQFIDVGQALAASALLISEDTGMIESPSVDVDGILTVKTELLPDVRPGRLVVMDAQSIKGNYRIEKAIWEGESWGKNWTITMHCRVY